MLRISFRCPHCQTRVELELDPRQEWTCTACKNVVDIPVPGEEGGDSFIVIRTLSPGVGLSGTHPQPPPAK
jgi:hypothetical protein